MTKHFKPDDTVVVQSTGRVTAAVAAALTPSGRAIRVGLVFNLVGDPEVTERSMALLPAEARRIAARLVELADACEAKR